MLTRKRMNKGGNKVSKKVKILIASLLVAVIATIGFGSIALAGNGGEQAGDCPNCDCDCGNQYHWGFDNAKGKALEPGYGEGTGTHDGTGLQQRWGQNS
jgi:hypothetical protein